MINLVVKIYLGVNAWNHLTSKVDSTLENHTNYISIAIADHHVDDLLRGDYMKAF